MRLGFLILKMEGILSFLPFPHRGAKTGLNGITNGVTTGVQVLQREI